MAELTQEEFNKQLVTSLDAEFRASRNERAKINAELAQMKAAVAPREIPNTPQPIGDVDNARMLERLREAPIDTFNSLLAIGEQKTQVAVRQALEQERAAANATKQNEAFWADVWNANPDISDMQHQVYGHFNQTDPHQDPSDRVNFAVQQVRTQIENRLKWSKEQELQQAQQKRMSSSAAMNAPWMNALSGVANQSPVVDARQDL